MAITLTGGIPTYFTDQFSSTLYHLCQQKESKFKQAVRVEPVLGAEDKAFDSIGMLELEAKTSRNPATPTIDITTQRRWVSTSPFHQAVLFDKDDDLSMIVDPRSDVQMELVRAINRKYDDIILAAIDGAVASGRRSNTSSITWASAGGTTKYTGKNTGRTIAWDTSSGNASAVDTGMTIEKIQLVKEYFAYNDVDENSPIWCAISPRQATNLFGQQEYTNNDYSNGKVLTTGRIIPNWNGINWIVSTKIVAGTSNDVDADTNVIRCPVWVQDGIILGVQDMLSTEMSIRDDLSYSQQIYVHMNMGAMRMDEDKVCYVECVA